MRFLRWDLRANPYEFVTVRCQMADICPSQCLQAKDQEMTKTWHHTFFNMTYWHDGSSIIRLPTMSWSWSGAGDELLLCLDTTRSRLLLAQSWAEMVFPGRSKWDPLGIIRTPGACAATQLESRNTANWRDETPNRKCSIVAACCLHREWFPMGLHQYSWRHSPFCSFVRVWESAPNWVRRALSRTRNVSNYYN